MMVILFKNVRNQVTEDNLFAALRKMKVTKEDYDRIKR